MFFLVQIKKRKRENMDIFFGESISGILVILGMILVGFVIGEKRLV